MNKQDGNTRTAIRKDRSFRLSILLTFILAHIYCYSQIVSSDSDYVDYSTIKVEYSNYLLHGGDEKIYRDSLQYLLSKSLEDNERLKNSILLFSTYSKKEPETEIALLRKEYERAKSNGYKHGEAVLLSCIGDIYEKDSNVSIEKYYECSLSAIRLFGEVKEYKNMLLEYQNLTCKIQPGFIFGSGGKVDYTIGFRPHVRRFVKYATDPILTEGLKYIEEGMKYIEQSRDTITIIQSLECLGDYYQHVLSFDSAYSKFNKSIELSFSLISSRTESDFFYLSKYYKSDSTFHTRYQKMEFCQQAIEKIKSEKYLATQKIIRNSFVGGFSVVLLFAVIFFNQRNKISKGKKLSDDLLLNILPSEVAQELKQKGTAEAKQFDEVTVMFTDFKDFSRISEKLSPSELVSEINICFRAFDNIIGKHNIEKIKTIGDSYMCAGGLPVANKTNATDVVSAAIEIQQFMQTHLQQRKSEGRESFEIRIGIHTGWVVAGIVGIKKFAYDIWGDTVNIASRLESSGEAGKINISETTYELVKNKFVCIARGKIQAKNKGEINMYFVKGV